eukprot:jgi/Chlat1/4760/Chrsp308S04725
MALMQIRQFAPPRLPIPTTARAREAGVFTCARKRSIASSFPPCHAHPSDHMHTRRGSHPPRIGLCAAEVPEQQAVEVSPPPNSTAIFYREKELAIWLSLLQTKPTNVLVMFGPRNCGKTTLLLELQRLRTQAGVRVDYLSMRASPVANPRALTDMLRSSLGTALSHRSTESALQQSVKAYPCIIIDEANMFAAWQGGDNDASLHHLFHFLVYITKEAARSAHIILATTEPLFLKWIQAYLPRYHKVIVTGDLPTSEAEVFCKEVAMRRLQSDIGRKVILSQESWPIVHAVCGGNIGSILQFTAFAQAVGDVSAAEAEWLGEEEASVQSIIGVDVPTTAHSPPAGWTTEQATALFKSLSSSPHGAVLLESLVENLPGDNQRLAVSSLVEHNAVSIGYFNARWPILHEIYPLVHSSWVLCLSLLLLRRSSEQLEGCFHHHSEKGKAACVHRCSGPRTCSANEPAITVYSRKGLLAAIS